jgi:hypothetical protein
MKNEMTSKRERMEKEKKYLPMVAFIVLIVRLFRRDCWVGEKN